MITGIARIKVDGELLESLPGAELDLGGYEAEAVTGHAVYGPREKVMPSVLTCTIAWKFETPIEKLRRLRNGVILFEADVGTTYRVNNAFTAKTVKVKDETGEITLEFQGEPAEQQ